MSAVALSAAGCGDDEGPQIPAQQSTALRDSLQQIKREVARDPCVSEASLTGLKGQIEALPDDLDEDVRQTLEDGVARLDELVTEECLDRPEPEEEQTDTEQETTPVVPTEPETDTTETEPIPTEPDEEPDPDGDGGDEGLPGGEPGSGGIGPGEE
jgi:hypothetical protein